MSMTTYHFTKISDAISNPKGAHAHMIDYHVDYILTQVATYKTIDIKNTLAHVKNECE